MGCIMIVDGHDRQTMGNHLQHPPGIPDSTQQTGAPLDRFAFPSQRDPLDLAYQPVEKPFPSQGFWIEWGMFEERDTKAPKQGEFWVVRDHLPAAAAGTFYRKLDETLHALNFAAQVREIVSVAKLSPYSGAVPIG